jgi:Protein of unknown function (DUF1822)
MLSKHHPYCTPQPGEIWQVEQTLFNPLQLSAQDQRQLYSEAAWRFLVGQGEPRYVMIVAKVEQQNSLPEWPAVTVMVLSSEIEFISNTDILIPAALSGLAQDILAETWHLQEMLTANLSHPVGCRLSHLLYGQLLTTGDFYRISTLPDRADLKTGECSVSKGFNIQAFHRWESDWSDVLTVPVATVRVYQKGIQKTDLILQEAIALEREFKPHPIRTNLNQWFQKIVADGWQTLAEVWPQQQLVIAMRNHEIIQPPNSQAITTLIHQLQEAVDEHQRRRIAEQLGYLATGDAEAIAALVNLLQLTTDDETCWTAVESLWRIDPGNPAAGIRRVKVIDLGMQMAGEAIALAVALVQRKDQTVSVLLQVYPVDAVGFLPPHLKLALLDPAGEVLREVSARQADIYIQLKFNGESGERFSVRIELETSKITEDFVI